MRSDFVLPLAIIAAGCIIAVSVYSFFYSRATQIVPGTGNPESVRPLDDTDHILGNPAAKVVLIEYSDIDCAFCKSFQKTMQEVMGEYAAGGKVAWAYRHLPISDLHPNAALHAEAAECAAASGGTGAFFKFIELLQEAAPGTLQFNPANYGTIVQKLGLENSAFSSCVTSHTFKKRVETDAQNAIAAGAAGAPYTVLLIQGQPPVPIAGAFTAAQMKEVIDAAVKKADEN